MKKKIKFSPTAWAKIQYLHHISTCEIGCFGISHPEDFLYVEEVVIIKQTVSRVHFEFDSTAIADYFDDQVDAGRSPNQFARILIHTHPGMGTTPSHTDYKNMKKVFGQCDWAVMIILSDSCEPYAMLTFNIGPRGDVPLKVEIDFSQPFNASNFNNWKEEYENLVTENSFIYDFDKKNHYIDYEEEWDYINDTALDEIERRDNKWKDTRGKRKSYRGKNL